MFSHSDLKKIAQAIDTAQPREIAKIESAPLLAEYPLSPQQRRWWNIYAPEENRSWATMVAFMEFSFDLKNADFRSAVDSLIAEQQALRLYFHRKQNGIHQKLHDPVSVDIVHHDFSEYPADEQVECLQRLKIEVANQEIDPFVWPLFRIHLVRRGPADHTLIFAAHHMISDGFSQNIIESAIREKLSAIKEGKPLPSAQPTTFEYLDYAIWAGGREKDGARDLQAAERYWNDIFHLVPTKKLIRNFADLRLGFR